MNYIYDIVLNFQPKFYQFYEWNRTDNIKNISKIPVFRISTKDILNFQNNKIKVEESFIKKIKEANKKSKKIICLVSNTQVSMGLLFTEEGILSKKSSLIFEEEEEVNIYSQTLPVTKITYIENTPLPYSNKLRIETEKKELLKKYITETQDLSTLKYIYFEYYKEECESKTTIKKSLLKELDNQWNNKQSNLYNLIKLLNKNNLPTK